MWRALLLFLLVIFLARAAWRLLEGIVRGASGGPPQTRAPGGPSPSVRMVKDPVCGTFVVPGKALSLVSRGDTIYFCSEQCRAAYGTGRDVRA
jgi:YHS domain-containing protein